MLCLSDAYPSYKHTRVWERSAPEERLYTAIADRDQKCSKRDVKPLPTLGALYGLGLIPLVEFSKAQYRSSSRSLSADAGEADRPTGNCDARSLAAQINAAGRASYVHRSAR